MFGRFTLEKLFKQIQGSGHKHKPIQDHGFHRYPGADLLMRILTQKLINGLNHTQLIDNARDDAQMIYGLDDDIDKTSSLDTTLTPIIDHYSECDNPEGGMWDPAWISGIFLWALALYLMFSPVAVRLVDTLEQQARLAFFKQKDVSGPAELYASVMSIVPFILAGGLCNYLLDISLGHSWTLSFGIIACMGSGVYELGRRDGEANQD